MRAFDVPDDAASGAATSPEGLAPRRLLDGGGTAFEQMLVEPSRSAGVPRASLERLAHALRLPPDALPVLPSETPASLQPESAAARGSGLARHASLLRLGVVGLVVGAMAVVGLRQERAGRDAPAAPLPANPAAFDAPPVASEVAVVGTRPANALLPASTPPGVTPAAASRASAAAARAEKRAEPRRAARQPQRAAPIEAPPSHGLGAELRALEAVQQALLERRPSAAGSALADYRQRFPDGELALEAELLGIEVALESGQPERARAQAHELSARPGAARYRERLEGLTRAAEAALSRSTEPGAKP